MLSCAEHATQIADRLDIDTGLSPLHHAARHQQLHICLMLLSNIHFKYVSKKQQQLTQWIILYSNSFGVNIKDANDRTPIHSAFRSSNNISNTDDQFIIETDLGNEVFQ